MPTLTRLLVFVAFVAAIVYGAMFALAGFVRPTTHEITVDIPASKLKQTVVDAPPPAAPQTANDDAPQAQE